MKDFDEEYRRLGAKIVYWRKVRGMSQEMLADMSTLCRSRLSEIENGKGPCNLDSLLLICRALGITLCELLDNDKARAV